MWIYTDPTSPHIHGFLPCYLIKVSISLDLLQLETPHFAIVQNIIMAFKQIDLKNLIWPPKSKWRLLPEFFSTSLNSKVLFFWDFCMKASQPFKYLKGTPKTKTNDDCSPKYCAGVRTGQKSKTPAGPPEHNIAILLLKQW